MNQEQRGRSLVTDAAVGVAAGLLGSVAMNLFVRTISALGDGREANDAARGEDRQGRGVQPAQAEGPARADATVRTGIVVFRLVAGDERLTRRVQRTLGVATHYAFGASMGLVYGVLAPRFPSLTAGFGTLFGTLVWATADEGVIPALGLSRGPRQLSRGLLAFGWGGHSVYGTTLEAVRRAAARFDRRRVALPAIASDVRTPPAMQPATRDRTA